MNGRRPTIDEELRALGMGNMFSNNSVIPQTYQANYGNNGNNRNFGTRIKNFFRTLMNNGLVKVLLFIGILLIVILVPLSFHGVEYNEYSYKKNTLTQKVDWSTYYTKGNHFWGVNYESFPFKRTLHRVELKKTSVIPTSGLEFFVDFTFYYLLDPKTIPEVYAQYAYSYNDQVVKLALGVIRDTTPNFQFNDYFSNRQVIQNAIEANLTSALYEKNFTLPKGFFMMQDMYFSAAVTNKYLQTAIQSQETQTAAFIQQQNYVQQQTNYMVSLYNNNASYINATTATAITTMIANANSQAFTQQETAKGRGLAYFRSLINVTKPENINTIVKIMAYLQYHPQIVQNGFNVIVGPVGGQSVRS